MTISEIRDALRHGGVLPAHPLALNRQGKLDVRRQRALSRYYLDAGVQGMAVGVHTTQFAIHDSQVGLYEPVLTIAAEEFDRFEARNEPKKIRIAGVIGDTAQATREAEIARRRGYHAALLGLGALAEASQSQLIEHCREVSDILPIFGFYLQPAVGGRVLPYDFWRRFAEIENLVAIKVAPFNRYQTLDVVRALIDAGRDDVALYTGNDDNIVLDLITPFRIPGKTGRHERRFVGGLLGHWAFWTRQAVALYRECREVVETGVSVSPDLLAKAIEVTDVNAAVFDAANGFAGCIAGIHEILRRQGLLETVRCLDDRERLSPGQGEEIDRVCRSYPHLADDEFVADHLEQWLSD
jgi:dihydrodipicolinate synthase/N-acetylneuraminate lyase